MRYIWTDAGDDPSWEVGDKHGINGYFAPLWDPITPQVLAEAGRRGHVRGVYLGHNWLPGKSPAEIAAAVSAEYKRLNIPGLRVMFNLEEHDPEKIASVLEEWRNLHRYVSTSWTMEPMQGGWMFPEFVQRVLNTRVRVVPQTFTGSMQRFESDVVVRDIVRRGFPETIVSPFYDARQLGLGWDGYAFTMGRLPL